MSGNCQSVTKLLSVTCTSLTPLLISVGASFLQGPRFSWVYPSKTCPRLDGRLFTDEG